MVHPFLSGSRLFHRAPLGGLLLTAALVLFGAGCSASTQPPPAEGDGAVYVGKFRGWEDFMAAGEDEIAAYMQAPPDTVAESNGGKVLVYHVNPKEDARLFILSAGMLVEDMYIRYFQDREKAEAFYQSAAGRLRGVHGKPTLEIRGGALWDLKTAGATDSLKGAIAAIRRDLAAADSASVGDLLAAASAPQRRRLVDLLHRHRSERAYMGVHAFANLYTVTLSRSAGQRALWDAAGDQMDLDTF